MSLPHVVLKINPQSAGASGGGSGRERMRAGGVVVADGHVLQHRVQRSKQREAAGVSMQVGRSAYRPDLTIAEESADRNGAHLLLKQPRIMAGFAVKVFAAAEAGEQQRAGDLVMSGASLIGAQD